MSCVRWGEGLSNWFKKEMNKIQKRCEKVKIISIWNGRKAKSES